LREALEPILKTIASLSARIRDYDRKLETLAQEHYQETELLRQVQGVGALTALAFVLTLEDPGRFEQSRAVGAYLGLVPGKDQSGEHDPQRRISGEGDEMLRRLLVGSAHYILGSFARDSDLRRHGMKIAERGARTPRRGRWWRWPASSRWCCITFGSLRRFTTRSTTPGGSWKERSVVRA
jgi:transposase